MTNPKAYKRYRTAFTQEAVHRAAEEGTTDKAVIGPRFSQRLKIGESGQRATLYVQVSYRQGILFDEIASGLYLVTH